jgi:hypothetical protein
MKQTARIAAVIAKKDAKRFAKLSDGMSVLMTAAKRQVATR